MEIGGLYKNKLSNQVYVFSQYENSLAEMIPMEEEILSLFISLEELQSSYEYQSKAKIPTYGSVLTFTKDVDGVANKGDVVVIQEKTQSVYIMLGFKDRFKNGYVNYYKIMNSITIEKNKIYNKLGNLLKLSVMNNRINICIGSEIVCVLKQHTQHFQNGFENVVLSELCKHLDVDLSLYKSYMMNLYLYYSSQMFKIISFDEYYKTYGINTTER